MERDLVIKLVRHGESRANIGELKSRLVGDHTIPLTDHGREQARQAGLAIGADFVKSALIYVSPYQRTRETFEELLRGAGVARGDLVLRPNEDPRLREVEHGYRDVEEQKGHRETHGWFYYRFDGGESPADCYDRMSGFIDSMWRQLDRKSEASTVLVVSHGLTLRCLVMRFLHLSVEDFEQMESPKNAAVITIARRQAGIDYDFVTGGWGCTGLARRGA